MSDNKKYTLRMVILLVLLIILWYFVMVFFITILGGIMQEARASETTITASVVESELRTCIESCGYKFK